jgi:opacity protein-like surface antigen
MKRLLATLMAAGFLAASQAAQAEMLGVRGLVGGGQKKLSHGDWGDFDKQVAFSLDLEAKLPLFPLSGTLGFLASGDTMDVPNGAGGTQELRVATTETSAGLRKTFEIGPLLPFVGGGLCIVDVKADRSADPFDEKTDGALGYYVSGGLRYQLGKIVVIGAQVRRSWAKVDLFGSEVQAGGTTILGEVGVGF